MCVPFNRLARAGVSGPRRGRRAAGILAPAGPSAGRLGRVLQREGQDGRHHAFHVAFAQPAGHLQDSGAIGRCRACKADTVSGMQGANGIELKRYEKRKTDHARPQA